VIYELETESGSVYTLNTEKQTWKKEKMPRYQGPWPLRTQSGVYRNISEIKIGFPILMTGKPLDKRATFRLIETTPIISIKELSDDS